MAERYARAEATAQAIVALLAQSKTPNTIQWMPEDSGCRFEVIRCEDGQLLQVARVRGDGTVVLADA